MGGHHEEGVQNSDRHSSMYCCVNRAIDRLNSHNPARSESLIHTPNVATLEFGTLQYHGTRRRRELGRMTSTSDMNQERFKRKVGQESKVALQKIDHLYEA